MRGGLPQGEAGEDHLGAVAEREGGFDMVGEGLLDLGWMRGCNAFFGNLFYRVGWLWFYLAS